MDFDQAFFMCYYEVVFLDIFNIVAPCLSRKQFKLCRLMFSLNSKEYVTTL